MKSFLYIIFIFSFLLTQPGCQGNSVDPLPDTDNPELFYFGADLSFVNHILDKGGVYKTQGITESPYKIFKDKGTNLVRLRLWHYPIWTKDVYGAEGVQLYNDLKDVEKSISLAKQQGMKVLLDFHYSDTWADPGNQKIPAAWLNIQSIQVLKDSVYNYTFKTLSYLKSKSLLPEMVQLGNETNCGMLYTDAPTGFPACNGCNNQWTNLRAVIKSGIQAVRDVSLTGDIKTKIILHVADPKNVDWWFTNVVNGGEVNDFDIIGFSYYPLWHTTVPVSQVSESVSAFKSKFGKDVMLVETAYPWTANSNDSYTNLFGSQTPISGFPYTNQGQLDMMKSLTQELIDGGGIGIIYWEPAWISSNMKDLWGTGSAWENTTFFDFNGEVNIGIQFMKHTYSR